MKNKPTNKQILKMFDRTISRYENSELKHNEIFQPEKCEFCKHYLRNYGDAFGGPFDIYDCDPDCPVFECAGMGEYKAMIKASIKHIEARINFENKIDDAILKLRELRGKYEQKNK